MEIAIENITKKTMNKFTDFIKSAYENKDSTWSIVIYANDFHIHHKRINFSNPAPLYEDIIQLYLKKGTSLYEVEMLSNEFTKIIVM